MEKTSVPNSAITGCLGILAQVVGLAVESIGEAQVLHSSGKQLEAVEVLGGLEGRLNEVLGLYRAILTLHRHR